MQKLPHLSQEVFLGFLSSHSATAVECSGQVIPGLPPPQDVSVRSRRLKRLRKRDEALSPGSVVVRDDLREVPEDCCVSSSGFRLSPCAQKPCTWARACECTTHNDATSLVNTQVQQSIQSGGITDAGACVTTAYMPDTANTCLTRHLQIPQ